MTDREVAAAGIGWIAGCLMATLACLAAIALETHHQRKAHPR